MATTNKNKDNDVIGIAKGTSGTRKKTSTRKPTVRKTIRKPAAKKSTVTSKLTPEQERDLKAKQKVEELLKDAELTPKKEDDLLELVDDEKKDEPKGVEWLEEQVQTLIDENKALKAENQALKEGGDTGNDELREAVVTLFDELQTNHIKLGTDPKSGLGNFRIYCPGFLNRMIKFFPFLNDYKKY